MKKRILACLLAVMLISAVLPVQAATSDFSTDIASNSWVCVDEALRIVVTMPDAAGAYNVGAYINGSEKAAATARISGTSATVVIPQKTLLPGDNTVSFKATNANGEQVGEAYSIIINGFMPLNSTVISATDFNSTSDAYEASYNETLANDGWTYNDYTAQTSYLSPEVLYGCDTVIWDDISNGNTIKREKHSESGDDMYLKYTSTTSSKQNDVVLQFKLKENQKSYSGEIIKLSMDIYANESDTFRYNTSCIEDASITCKLFPFKNMNKGWYHVVGYFDPAKKSASTYLYREGKLVGNDIGAWNTENGLDTSDGSFGFYLRMKNEKTAGFDNIKFERLSLGHYDDFSVTMSEPETEGKYVDSAAMTVIAYGEGAKVYIDGVKVAADITNGAETVYNIDGSVYNYGRKNIRVDYKRVNEFETEYRNILLKDSSLSNGNYVNYLTTTQVGSSWIEIENNILSDSDLSGSVRMKLAIQSQLASSEELYVWENGKNVTGNYKVRWAKGGWAYEISNTTSSVNKFKPNSYYKVIVNDHSIYFYTPGDSGAYLNLYDAELTDGNFSVMVEKAASAKLANPVKLIVAVYNGDELVKVMSTDLTIDKGVDATGVNLSFTGEATRAKAFIFDGLDSITPLTASIEAK